MDRLSRMSIDNALASVAVKDLVASKDWYARVLGRDADGEPMPGLAEWRFPRGGGLQVYELAERAGEGSFTLSVSNVDEAIAHLDALGIDTHARTANAQVKTVSDQRPRRQPRRLRRAARPDDRPLKSSGTTEHELTIPARQS